MKTKTITKKVFTYIFFVKSLKIVLRHGGQEREDRGSLARRHTHSGNHEGGGGLPEHHLSREKVFAEGRYSK
jgi:hypothetical protein